MSSERRPWFPWYPRDFGQDEKVRALSDDAELIYRRVLDVMWQASDLHLPCNCRTLANQVARGWTSERFNDAWEEIMMPGFELLKTTDDGQKVYSKRLKREAEKIEKLSKKRADAAHAKHLQCKCRKDAHHMHCHTDTDTDKELPPISPKGGNGYDINFERWWKHYPKKVGKDAAYRSWKKATNKASNSKLIESIKEQIEKKHFQGKDGSDYVPNPATWLNQGRYQDEIEETKHSDVENIIGKRLA